MDRSDEADDNKPRSRSARRRRTDDEGRPRRKKATRARRNPLLLWGLIGGVTALVLAGVVIGAVLIMNGRKRSSSTSPSGNPSGGMLGNPFAGATTEIKADDLTREMVAHMQNPEGFRRKYSIGTLLIDGKVFGSEQEGPGEFRLFLAGHKDPGGAMVTGVTCIFTGDQIAEAKKLNNGSAVRIACKLSPLTSNAKGVIVEECRVMSPR